MQLRDQRRAAKLFVALAALAVPRQALCADTKIELRQIIVSGNQDVEATAINNHGVVVGNLYAGITGAVSAIQIVGDAVSTLAPPYPNGETPHPKAIDDMGDVAGWADNGLGDPVLYFSVNGRTLKNYARLLDLDGNGHTFIVQPIGIADQHTVFGTVIFGGIAPNIPFYGTPSHYFRVPLFNSFERLNSISKHGVVGGVSFDSRGQFEAFYGTEGHYTMLLPPGAQQSQGGYVNTLGEVAGSYTDGDGKPHGFIYYGGKYQPFDMPSPAASITVTAINDVGRVVGTYASASADGRQHSFLYNGTTVTTFGTYSSLDTVLVALNDHGEMLVDRQLEYSAYPQFLSYRATCDGSGC